MLSYSMAIAVMLAQVLPLLTSAAAASVWPPPQTFIADGEPVRLAPTFHATAPSATLNASPRLGRAIQRFDALIFSLNLSARAAASATATPSRVPSPPMPSPLLSTLDIDVSGDLSESLGTTTDCRYTLTLSDNGTRAAVTAPTIYGAMYALETFVQLVDREHGTLPATALLIDDAPDYGWRGLLVDVGRRFAPVPLLQNLIDTMAAVKLNVLHLHLSDFCRFGVESALYPELTASLGPGSPNAGFYTHADIAELVSYGGDRGVRIVPEVEIPGHALGLLPLASVGGLEFCNTCAYGPTGNGSGTTCKPSQLWGTPGTTKVLKALLGEMAALFVDDVFHIGADETFVKPGAAERCDANTTAALEKAVVAAVANDFHKTPAGWEQVLFETGAATNATIVYAYISGASRVTATGHRAVVSNGSALYFTAAAPGGPKGWAKLWYDIGFDVPPSQKHLVLGGEMSMWTDTYCSPRECGAMPAYHTELGGALYARSQDAAYGKSLGGMVWPRGYVGAGAFWNWDASTDATSAEFAAKIWAVNDGLAARGALVCPSNCSCDQMTACGKPYMQG
eukprot:m.138437 g.138437  ORF g.138437 m.138437 type:complete len:567 (+) comp22726_c0_seq1:53-1753(+)